MLNGSNSSQGLSKQVILNWWIFWSQIKPNSVVWKVQKISDDTITYTTYFV